jgi:hypothetical protein
MTTPHRRALTRRSALAALAGVAVARSASAQAPSSIPVAATNLKKPLVDPITVTARPIESFSKLSSSKTFGHLTFRGGLVLSSDHRSFGGWSGLVVEGDGRRFLSVTDDGHWMAGEITYAGTAPSGLANVRLGEILAMNGRVLTSKRDADAEAITLVDGNLTRGTALVAFERNHRIGRYPIVDRTLMAPAGFLRMPPEARQMKQNRGLEAMTVMTGGPFKGNVIAFSENYPDAAGNHTGWIWIAGDPKRMHITEDGGFELTDIASLSDGSLLVLERRFRWTEGVKMRLRRLSPGEIGPGVVAKGEVLVSVDMANEIDNMEGLAIHRGASGETVLTMISDDNFNSLLQRTILLQFTLR